MPFIDIPDERPAFKDHRDRILCVRITSNDKTFHLPSFKDTLHHILDDLGSKDEIDNIINIIISEIKTNDNLTLKHWKVKVPLANSEFEYLELDIYPTYESWKYIREERDKDVV